MKVQTVFALLLPISMLAAQNATDTPEAHVAIAKTAAGEDYQNLFNFLCAAPAQRGGEEADGGGAAAGAPRGQGGGGAASVPRRRAGKAVARGEPRTDQPGMPSP